MMRRVLALLGFLTLALVLSAQAADKPKANKEDPKTRDTKDRTLLQQKRLLEQFDQFKAEMLHLKQKLEKSDKRDDKEKVKALSNAMREIERSHLDRDFRFLIKVIDAGLATTNETRQAKELSTKLQMQLGKLIDILREDNRAAKLRDERKRLEELIKELEGIIKAQKIAHSKIAAGKMDKGELGPIQKNVTDRTADLLRKLEGKAPKSNKGSEAKKGDDRGESKAKGKGKEGDSKSKGKGAGETKNANKGKKGEGKEGAKGKGKEGQSKEGAKGGKGKEGDGKGKGKGQGEAKDNKDGKSGKGKEGDGKGGKGEGKEGKAGQGKDAGKGKGSKAEGKAGGKAGEKANKGGKAGEGKAGKGQGKSQGKGQGQGKGKGKGKGEGKGKGDGKGEGKGKGDGKAGEGKGGKGGKGKSGGKGGKSGEGDMGDPGDQPDKPDQPVEDTVDARKKIQDAKQLEKDAEAKIEEDKKKKAAEAAKGAAQKLEEAKKKLEELLRQTREEELERLLNALENRCRQMLEMQRLVKAATIAIDKSVLTNKDKKPDRTNIIDSGKQADKEQEIINEANKAIEMIKAEGTAVAFAEVFDQVREDMKQVKELLEKTKVNTVTQGIEQDIIDELEAMIKALQKAKQELQQGKPNPSNPNQSPPPDPKLLDDIAQLKMIRSRQMRVNLRTKMYARMYVPKEGEQTANKEIKTSLKKLSTLQDRLFDVTMKIVKGDNK